MERTDGGLYVAHSFSFLRFRAKKRTVTLPSGERALVTVDDSGTVQQTEHGDHLDALVRPNVIRMALRNLDPGVAAAAAAHPMSIHTKARSNGPSR
jgi:hypothetical protein